LGSRELVDDNDVNKAVTELLLTEGEAEVMALEAVEVMKDGMEGMLLVVRVLNEAVRVKSTAIDLRGGTVVEFVLDTDAEMLHVGGSAAEALILEAEIEYEVKGAEDDSPAKVTEVRLPVQVGRVAKGTYLFVLVRFKGKGMVADIANAEAILENGEVVAIGYSSEDAPGTAAGAGVLIENEYEARLPSPAEVFAFEEVV
jgi:hypothetical protein